MLVDRATPTSGCVQAPADERSRIRRRSCWYEARTSRGPRNERGSSPSDTASWVHNIYRRLPEVTSDQ
jgi:hypothetical protein